jgi:hypothetical protein
MRIGRTLFFFKNGYDALHDLGLDFYGLCNLLNTLMNERYNGKKITFINIYFYSESAYEVYPALVKGYYYYGGHLTYNSVLDFDAFLQLSEWEQTSMIWEKSYLILKESAIAGKNKDLLAACEYAYEKGKAIDYCTDMEVTTSLLILFERSYQAAIIILFEKEALVAKLVLKDGESLVYEKIIWRTVRGMELFLEIFERIVSAGNIIIIQGPKDIPEFPMTIHITKEELHLS